MLLLTERTPLFLLSNMDLKVTPFFNLSFTHPRAM